MKKVDPDHPQSLGTSNPDMPDQTRTTAPSPPTACVNRSRSATFSRFCRMSTLSHCFAMHAKTSLHATNLAGEVEGPQRNVTLAIQQLTVLSGLLVNRALDNLDPP